MGSGGGASVDRSPLENKQKTILDSREAFYQKTTQPALLDFFEASKNFELDKNWEAPTGAQLGAENVNRLNQSYGQAGDQLQQSLAQRGLSGSGVEAGSLAMLGGAQANAVGSAVNQSAVQAMMQRNQVNSMRNQALMQEQGVYGGGLSALLGQAPQPTGSIGTSVVQQDSDPWAEAGMGVLGAGAELGAAWMTGGASLALTQGKGVGALAGAQQGTK